MKWNRWLLALVLAGLWPGLAAAAELDGSQLSALWAVPFASLLLSIAVMPLAAPFFWHHHFGKVAAGWSLAFLLPFALVFGPAMAGVNLVHALLAEYIPFMILLTALFTVAGGIYIRGNLHGAPVLNTAILAIGAVLASVMGTTGASMLMIRPLIRANDNRKHQVHVVVFFIFIVSNAGGSLTPLGDPPLFLGFLKGVDFFWTVKHIFPETLFLIGSLLTLFFLLDSWYYHRNREVRPVDPTPDTRRIGFDGKMNFLLLGVIMGLVLLSGVWKSAVVFDVFGTERGLPGIVRDIGLIIVTLISLNITPRKVHEDNQFAWGPMQEVAKLFAGIFLTIIPVIAMLKAGVNGPFGAVVAAVTRPDGSPDPAMYFWASVHPELLPRQCADLPGVLQYRRRRSAGAHDHDGHHAGRHFGGRGVHGGQHLHRQCAQPDGQSHCRRPGCQDAQLLRLHGLVVRHSGSAVPHHDTDLVSLTHCRSPSHHEQTPHPGCPRHLP
jgi:Na+/H+ antiporter NhaD/arsenite permease-like protein